MSNDPYAAPSADLDNRESLGVIQTKVFGAQGRLGVLSTWGQFALMYLIFFLVMIAGGALVYFLAPNLMADLENPDFSDPIVIVMTIIAVILALMAVYVSWCIIIKRLHDRNHSGWWSLLVLVPLVNFIVLLYLMIVPGKKVGNRYGGVRPTKTWEKILGILYILFTIATYGYMIFQAVMVGAAI